MRAPDIHDHLRDAVEQICVNGSRNFTIEDLKSAFPELSEYSRREIIKALKALSRQLDIEQIEVSGQHWSFI